MPAVTTLRFWFGVWFGVGLFAASVVFALIVTVPVWVELIPNTICDGCAGSCAVLESMNNVSVHGLPATIGGKPALPPLGLVAGCDGVTAEPPGTLQVDSAAGGALPPVPSCWVAVIRTGNLTPGGTLTT